MKCMNEHAYDKLLLELKNEFPFFKKYHSNFFISKKKKELENSHNFPSIVKKKDTKNEIRNYCSAIIEEMENVFSVIGNTSTVHKMCTVFLNSYQAETNSYYEYINCNYSNSLDVENLLKEFVENEKSNKNEDFVKKRIDEEKISKETLHREICGYVNKEDNRGIKEEWKERNRKSKRNTYTYGERRECKETGIRRNTGIEKEREIEQKKGSEKEREIERKKGSEKDREIERNKGSEEDRELERKKGSEKDRAIERKKGSEKERETKKETEQGKYIKKESRRERKRGKRENESGENGNGSSNTNANSNVKNEIHMMSVDNELHMQISKKNKTRIVNKKKESDNEHDINYSVNKRKLKTEAKQKKERIDFFQEETINNEVGFCDVSLIPFADNSFHINFGCFDIDLYNEHLEAAFIIDNENTDIDTVFQNKRMVVLGKNGRKTFLKNIKQHSMVSGWIFKYDYTYNFFYVKIFAVKNEQTDMKNKTINKCSRKHYEPNDNNVYACLPLQFIHKFEFVKDLNCKGLPFNNINYFMYMFLRAEIFDDDYYIKQYFPDILENSNCNFDFFITLNSKTYANNERLGFCSQEFRMSTTLDGNRDPKVDNEYLMETWTSGKLAHTEKHKKRTVDKTINLEEVHKKQRHIIKSLGTFLFSDKNFYNFNNLKHKKNLLLLNVFGTPSLIKYHYRNVNTQMHIGNIITKKQNLIWSNEKLLEALEIYKNNSKYYNIIKNHFDLNFCSKHPRYIYKQEQDNFVNASDLITHPLKVAHERKSPTKDKEHFFHEKHTHERHTHERHTHERHAHEKRTNEMKLENKKYKENSKKKKEERTEEKIRTNTISKNNYVKTYTEYISSLGDTEQYIIKNIVFLNTTIYEEQWIYDFFSSIKLTINLNDQNVLPKFLLSLVLLELSCYTEAFLVLFRIFKLKKLFLESYKLKNIICSFFMKQLKTYINKETLWDTIIKFPNFDIFDMHRNNCEEYKKNVFQRNIDIINALKKI